MGSILIEKYSNIMKSLYEITQITTNIELKEFCLEKLEKFIIELYNKEKTNYEEYKNILNSFKLNENKLVKIEEVYADKVDSISEEDKFIEYKNELVNIFNNPNEESIKVWLKNVISYSNEKKLDEKVVDEFIYNSFKEVDKENDYIDKLHDYIEEIRKTTIKAENVDKENDEINEGLKDAKNNQEDNGLEKEEPNEDIKKQEKESDLKTEEDNEDEKQKDVENPLKIVKVKRSFKSPLITKSLAIGALVGVGALTNPLTAIAVGCVGYALYMKNVKEAKEIIIKSGLNIDENNNLSDKNGKIINKSDLGNLKYLIVRNQLENINTKEGKIDKSFKKNRLTSMLFAPAKKVVDYIKMPTINNVIKNKDIEDINKGMRLIK